MRGFTLVELLVAVAIIAIVATMAVLNFRNAREQQKLQEAATALQSVLRVAQNNAASGAKCNGTDVAIDWRLTLRSDNYSLDNTCPTTSTIPSKVYNLPIRVTIDQLGTENCPSSALSGSPAISFQNITSNVRFNLGSSLCSINLQELAQKLTVTIKSLVTAQTVSLVVEKSGNIYVAP